MIMSFEEFWGKLKSVLRVPQLIRNWTIDNGYLGKGDFEAVCRAGNYIECAPPEAIYLQRVPKRAFQFLFNNWQDYLSRRIKRSQLRDESRFTKYTISLLHQYAYLL